MVWNEGPGKGLQAWYSGEHFGNRKIRVRAPVEVHGRTVSHKSGSTTIPTSRSHRALDLTPLCPVVPLSLFPPSLALSGGLYTRAQW